MTNICVCVSSNAKQAQLDTLPAALSQIPSMGMAVRAL